MSLTHPAVGLVHSTDRPIRHLPRPRPRARRSDAQAAFSDHAQAQLSLRHQPACLQPRRCPGGRHRLPTSAPTPPQEIVIAEGANEKYSGCSGSRGATATRRRSPASWTCGTSSARCRARRLAWFDHYVRDRAERRRRTSSYFRDWVYAATGSAAEAVRDRAVLSGRAGADLVPLRRPAGPAGERRRRRRPGGADAGGGSLVPDRRAVCRGPARSAASRRSARTTARPPASTRRGPVFDPPGDRHPLRRPRPAAAAGRRRVTAGDGAARVADRCRDAGRHRTDSSSSTRSSTTWGPTACPSSCRTGSSPRCASPTSTGRSPSSCRRSCTASRRATDWPWSSPAATWPTAGRTCRQPVTLTTDRDAPQTLVLPVVG